MKRATFKTEFNGVTNALNMIPESYKTDNNTFEMTDGNETYRMRWEGTLTEGKAAIIMASDKELMNEDMQKMKHLMGYKSQDTLGNLKGSQRIDENASFQDIWGKTSKLINEGAESLLKDNKVITEDATMGKVRSATSDVLKGMTGDLPSGDIEGTTAPTVIDEAEVDEEVSEEVSEEVNENASNGGMMGFVPEGDLTKEEEEGINEMDGEDSLPDVQSAKEYMQKNHSLIQKIKKINNIKEKLQFILWLSTEVAAGDTVVYRKVGTQLLKMAGDTGEGDDTAEIAQDGMGGSMQESEEEKDTFDTIFEGMYEGVDEDVNEDIDESCEDNLKGDQKDLDVEPEGGDGDIDAKDLAKLRKDK